MPDAPSFFTRLAIAEMAGVFIGLLCFVMVQVILPDADPRFHWGVLLWYPTLAGVVALVGGAVPERSRPGIPWWLRGAGIGAWMNLIAVLFEAERMRQFLVAAFGADAVLASPYWFIAEGALAGGIIGYVVSRFEREGPGLLND